MLLDTDRHTIYVAPEDSHFSDINVLGADFCNANIPYFRTQLQYEDGEIVLQL